MSEKLKFNEHGIEFKIEVYNTWHDEWQDTVYRFKSDLADAVENATKLMRDDLFFKTWRVIDENNNVVHTNE